MKKRIMLMLSLFFAVSLLVSCYVNEAQDNPNDPGNPNNSENSIANIVSVTSDKLNLEIGYGLSDSATNVTQNVTLPTTGSSGTTISWNSGNTVVITNTGAVTRPDYYLGNASVTLTATIAKGSASDIKQFTLTIIKAPKTDDECVAADTTSLNINYQSGDSVSNVKHSVGLSLNGSSGTTITWATSNSAVLTVNGNLVPAYPPSTASVTLTATIKKNSSINSKTFNLTVIQNAIGATGPGGGIIFYDNGSPTTDTTGVTYQYMEVTKSDLSTGIIWTTSSYQGTSLLLQAYMGYGRANTNAIVAQVESGTPPYPLKSTYAAGLCKTYNGGGKSDWFLPTYNEMVYIFNNLSYSFSFTANYYWSSCDSLSTGGTASCFYLGDGYHPPTSNNKNNIYCVRAVRTF